MQYGPQEVKERVNREIETLLGELENPDNSAKLSEQLQIEFVLKIQNILNGAEAGAAKQVDLPLHKLNKYKAVLDGLRNLGFQLSRSKPAEISRKQGSKENVQKGDGVLLNAPINEKTKRLDYEMIKDLVVHDLEQNYDYRNQEMVINDMRFIEKTGMVGPLSGVSYFAAVSPNYGVKFKKAQESLVKLDEQTNEANIFFMGTGGSIHVGGKHKDVYEGGDVLCHLGLHKGLEQNQPTLLVRGLGTSDDFQSATVYYDKKDKVTKDANTSGSVLETVFAGGLNERLRISMEQFFIPTLLQMTDKKLEQKAIPCELTFNIVGHSRGAITSYAMADLIDQWMDKVCTMEDKEIDLMAQIIAKEFESATKSKTVEGKKTTEKLLNAEKITQALKAVRDRSISFKTKLMIYDPVEGDMGCGDQNYRMGIPIPFSYKSTITTPIFGSNIVCDYGNIPSSVKDAQIFLGFDERRVTFQPTVSSAEDPTQTNVVVMPVIGVHGTLKGYFSKFDDTGQDSYERQKGSVFLKEALRASADLVKVKSVKFIFDELPAFETVTLCNIFYANNGQGYVTTKKHLLESLSQAFNLSIEELENLAQVELIDLCKKVMKDQNLARQLYFDLEKDVHEIYLSPKDLNKALELRDLREEMRLDEMLALKHKGNQSANEVRKVWNRKKGTQYDDRPRTELTSKYPSLKYDPFADIWCPNSSCIGRSLEDGFADPFYFNLLDTFSEAELAKMSSHEREIVNDLVYDFADLNEKGARYALNHSNKSAADNYLKTRDKFAEKLNTTNVSDNLKAKIFSILMMKEEFQYGVNIHIDGCVKLIKNEIKKQSKLEEVKYQVNMALKLMDNNNFKDYPNLYYKINELIKRVEPIQDKIDDDVEFGKLMELKRVLAKQGVNIVKHYLTEELNSLTQMLSNYNYDENSKLKGEENSIQSRITQDENENTKLENQNLELKRKLDTCPQDEKPKISKEIESNVNKIKANKISIESNKKSLANKVAINNEKRMIIDKLVKQMKEVLENLKRNISDSKSMDDLQTIEDEIKKLSNKDKKVLEQYANINSFIFSSLKLYYLGDDAYSYTNTLIDNLQRELQKDEISRKNAAEVKLATMLRDAGYQRKMTSGERMKSLSNSIYHREKGVLESFINSVKNQNTREVYEYIEASKNSGTMIRGPNYSEVIDGPRDASGNSALHLIVISENPDLLELVAESAKCFDLTVKNKEGLTPLEIAVKSEKPWLVEGMREVYKQKEIKEEDFKKLVFDIKYPIDKERVAALVKEINLDYKNSTKKSFQSFMDSIKNENFGEVAAYIQASKDYNAPAHDYTTRSSDDNGNNALHLIAQMNDERLWDVVIQSGYKGNKGYYKPSDIFDFEKKNKEGLTPLAVAVKTGKPRIVEQMREFYKNIPQDQYERLLERARHNLDKKERGKNNVEKALRTRPLMHSTPNAEIDIQKGINEKKREVFDSLLTAVKAGDVNAVKMYIECSKNSKTSFAESMSSARDNRGNTALHLIAKSHNPELWKLVAESGYKASTFATWTYPYHIFDFTAKNDIGLTPIEVAVKTGNVETVKGMKDMYKYSEKDFAALVQKAQENFDRGKDKENRPKK